RTILPGPGRRGRAAVRGARTIRGKREGGRLRAGFPSPRGAEEECMQTRVDGQAHAKAQGAGVVSRLFGGGFDQLRIVTLLFLVIFAVYSLMLPGFFTVGNLLTLTRTVAVLGILGLGMAIVVIGRGIDLSLIASLAVPSALVLTL